MAQDDVRQGQQWSAGQLRVLPLAQAKNDIRKKIYSRRVVVDKLPDLVKHANTVNTFKNRLDDVMFLAARWSNNIRQATAHE